MEKMKELKDREVLIVCGEMDKTIPVSNSHVRMARHIGLNPQLMV